MPHVRMGMWLTGSAHGHREWGCASSGMHASSECMPHRDVPHRECMSSLGIHIVYRVLQGFFFWGGGGFPSKMFLKLPMDLVMSERLLVLDTF